MPRHRPIAAVLARRRRSPCRPPPARTRRRRSSRATSRPVEVYDRHDHTLLPVYEDGGERWIVGTPGHEYAIRIRNHTGQRILAVPSVDGVNAITGETASPEQSGYVLEPYGSVEIAGWRKSLSHTAAFYFTELADSYAARTGRPHDVGVIGVAVFRERAPHRLPPRNRSPKIAEQRRSARTCRPAAAPPMRENAARRRRALAKEARRRHGRLARRAARASKRVADSRLGTGHGRSETSYAQQVALRARDERPRRRSCRSATTAARTWSRWASCPARATPTAHRPRSPHGPASRPIRADWRSAAMPLRAASGPPAYWAGHARAARAPQPLPDDEPATRT